MKFFLEIRMKKLRFAPKMRTRAIHKSAFKFGDNTRNPKMLQTICRKFAVCFVEYAAGWRGEGVSKVRLLWKRRPFAVSAELVTLFFSSQVRQQSHQRLAQQS